VNTLKEEKRCVIITFKAPQSLKELIKKYIEQDTYISRSDFLRDAAREKIQRDTPELYRSLFKTGNKQQ